VKLMMESFTIMARIHRHRNALPQPPDYAGPKVCRSEENLEPPGIIRLPA